MASLGDMFVTVGAKIDGFKAAMAEVVASIDTTSLKGMAAFTGMAGAIALLGKEALGLVEDFGAAAEATQNLADRLNLTFTQTRELQDMAKIAGVELGGLQKSAAKLAEAMADTGGEGRKVAVALNEIGATGHNSGEMLLSVLNKLAEIPDTTKRIAVAHEILGKSSQELIPLIKNYGELKKAIAELGPTLDENMAKKLQHADDTLDKLSIAWKRFKEQIAAAESPGIVQLVTNLTKLLTLVEKLSKEHHYGLTAFFTGGFAAARLAKRDKEAGGGADASYADAETDAGLLKEMLEPDAIRRSKDLSDSIAVLVAQERLEIAAKQAAIEETAKFNEQMGASLALFDYYDVKLAAAVLNQSHFADLTQEEGPQILDTYTALAKAIDEVDKTMKTLGADTAKAHQEMLANTPYGQLEEGLKRLGITSVAEYQKQAESATLAYDLIRNSGLAVDDELTAAWIKMQLAVVEAAYRAGDLQIEEYAQRLRALKAMQEEYDKTHEVSVQLRGARERSLGEQVQQIGHQMFTSLERDLARDIVQWKGWGDTLKNLWQTLAEDLLQIMLKTALQPLEKEFAKLLDKIFGGGQAGGGVLGTSVGAAGGAAGTLGGGGGASGVAGAVSGGLAGTLTAVFSGVNALFSGIGMFQNMHQETSLNAIEHNTRYSMMYLGERADGGILGVLFKIAEQVSWGPGVKAMEASRDILGQIRDKMGAGSSGAGGSSMSFVNCTFNGVSQDTVNAFAQSMAQQIRLAGVR